MSAHIPSLSELNQHVTDARIREVGVVDTIRFLNQCRTGYGDYTAEREGLLQGMTVKDIFNGMKARRTGAASTDSRTPSEPPLAHQGGRSTLSGANKKIPPPAQGAGRVKATALAGEDTRME